MPCRAVPWPREVAERHGRSTARAWRGLDMVSVNQTLPHCLNQIEKTQSETLAVRHGMAGERHGHGMLCVN